MCADSIKQTDWERDLRWDARGVPDWPEPMIRDVKCCGVVGVDMVDIDLRRQ
jgi:hypothetical protein